MAMTPWQPRSNKDNFIVQDLDDETLAYNPRTGQVTHLNPQSAAIWNLCDGTRNIAQMAQDLDKTQELVNPALEEFLKLGLLIPPTETQRPRLSRRDLLVKSLIALT